MLDLGGEFGLLGVACIASSLDCRDGEFFFSAGARGVAEYGIWVMYSVYNVQDVCFNA